MASSILGKTSMGSPFLFELKKQASFFLKEKIKTARLALTDVTPAQLLTEEVTSGSSWAPDAKTMRFISRAAFEIDDYWRIVEILHKRLDKFDRKRWREPYHALIVLEHLLTHGPESVANEFQTDVESIEELATFQYIDERGFNWGLTVRKKSERVLKLLEKGPLLKEERDRARKVTRGIQGFGSFNHRWSSTASTCEDQYARSNSHYEDFNVKEDNSDSLVELGAHANNKCVDAVVESKPLLPGHEDEPKVEDQKEEHPFSSVEHERMKSSLLLRQT